MNYGTFEDMLAPYGPWSGSAWATRRRSGRFFGRSGLTGSWSRQTGRTPGASRVRRTSQVYCPGHVRGPPKPPSLGDAPDSARRRLVDRQRFPDRLFRHLDLDARALLLQQHRHARVALGPAAIERLGHLLERDVGQPHRHLVLAAERRRQSDVLVGQPQRERRWVELPRQELIGEPVERAPPASGALADRLPQRDRLDTGLDAHREDLGQRGL